MTWGSAPRFVRVFAATMDTGRADPLRCDVNTPSWEGNVPIIATAGVAASLAGTAAKIYGVIQNRNNEEMRRVGDEALLVFLQRLCQDLESLALTEDDVRAKLADERLSHLLYSFQFEAFREAMPDRRAMLASVAAALVASGWEIDRKARVERCVRQLDVGHLMLLRALAVDVHDGEDQIARANLVRDDAAGSALMVAGCVYELHVASVGGGHQEVYFTELGHDVLRASAGFEREPALDQLLTGCDRLFEEPALATLATLRQFGRSRLAWARWVDSEIRVGWAKQIGPEPHDLEASTPDYVARCAETLQRSEGWRSDAIAIECGDPDLQRALLLHLSPHGTPRVVR